MYPTLVGLMCVAELIHNLFMTLSLQTHLVTLCVWLDMYSLMVLTPLSMVCG